MSMQSTHMRQAVKKLGFTFTTWYKGHVCHRLYRVQLSSNHECRKRIFLQCQESEATDNAGLGHIHTVLNLDHFLLLI